MTLINSSLTLFLRKKKYLNTVYVHQIFLNSYRLSGWSLTPIQLYSKLFNPLAFPITSIVNKSCNIDCCVNSMLPINQNMIVSQGLELILSMFRRTTMSGKHPLIQVWVQNFQNYSTPCSHCISIIIFQQSMLHDLFLQIEVTEKSKGG